MKINFQKLNSVCSLLIILFIIPTGALFASETTKSDNFVSLDDAVNIAIKNNPGLEAKRSQYQAMSQIPDQMGALPEPRLMLNALSLPIDSFSLSKSPMTQIQLGISQNLPYPGKLDLKADVAFKESLASKEVIQSSFQSLVRQVKHYWWQLFYIDRSLDTVSSNMELLSEFIDVAETKYTVGQGLQQEVLLAHVELARLEDSELQIQAMREKTEAMLNSLLDQNSSTPIKINKKVSLDLPNVKSIDQLMIIAEKNRPEIKKAMLKIAASQGRIALAEKDYYPDFKLGAVYGWRKEQTDLASVQFSMNLPFNTEKRQDRKKDQRQHEWLQQKFMLQDLKNKVAKEIRQALADYDRSKKQTSIYQGQIIPQATQTVDSMLAGYQVNKVDFLNLLRSQVNLFNFQTQYWQALSAANQALAALEYAAGSEVIYEQ